ncbi:MAG: hypothetical protein KAJ14_00545, partial [Candidatus Omnitrophica bacterium]|nr:hypothetical protein [Candidatus Omnitrophota bacterium]
KDREPEWADRYLKKFIKNNRGFLKKFIRRQRGSKSAVTQNIITELSKQAWIAYQNKKAGGAAGQEWREITTPEQKARLGGDIRGLDVDPKSKNIRLPAVKSGVLWTIMFSSGKFFSAELRNDEAKKVFVIGSYSTEKYQVVHTNEGISITENHLIQESAEGEVVKPDMQLMRWISQSTSGGFKDIIARDTLDGCEILGLDDQGTIINITYHKKLNSTARTSWKLKDTPSLFTFKKLFWNKDRTKILASDGAKNLCLLTFDVSDSANRSVGIEAYAFDIPISDVVDIIEDENGNILVLGNKIEVDDKGVTISESSELQIAVLEQTSGDTTILHRKNDIDKECVSLKVKHLIPLKNSPISNPVGMGIREGKLLIAGYGKKDKELYIWETALDSLLAQDKQGMTLEEVDPALEQLFEKFIADTKEATLSEQPIAASPM